MFIKWFPICVLLLLALATLTTQSKRKIEPKKLVKKIDNVYNKVKNVVPKTANKKQLRQVDKAVKEYVNSFKAVEAKLKKNAEERMQENLGRNSKKFAQKDINVVKNKLKKTKESLRKLGKNVKRKGRRVLSTISDIISSTSTFLLEKTNVIGRSVIEATGVVLDGMHDAGTILLNALKKIFGGKDEKGPNLPKKPTRKPTKKPTNKPTNKPIPKPTGKPSSPTTTQKSDHHGVEESKLPDFVDDDGNDDDDETTGLYLDSYNIKVPQ